MDTEIFNLLITQPTMNWELQIRNASDKVIASFQPVSDQEHIRVTLQRDHLFWKRYKGGEWKALSLIPNQYVIILGINDCAINSDTQHENLLRELEQFRKKNEELELGVANTSNPKQSSVDKLMLDLGLGEIFGVKNNDNEGFYGDLD